MALIGTSTNLDWTNLFHGQDQSHLLGQGLRPSPRGFVGRLMVPTISDSLVGCLCGGTTGKIGDSPIWSYCSPPEGILVTLSKLRTVRVSARYKASCQAHNYDKNAMPMTTVQASQAAGLAIPGAQYNRSKFCFA